MLRRDRLHALSAQDAVQMVVSYAEPSDVDTVMIAGRLVKRHGRLAFGGVAERSQQLRASAERLLHDAGIVV
jgi:cytosine/adenosine deaminase-related metal-dependent hydrolase